MLGRKLHLKLNIRYIKSITSPTEITELLSGINFTSTFELTVYCTVLTTIETLFIIAYS